MQLPTKQVPKKYIGVITSNWKLLRKAVWLNNNILQLSNTPYEEIILFADNDTKSGTISYNVDVIYFAPSSEGILSLDVRYAKVCMYLYNNIYRFSKDHFFSPAEVEITAGDMIEWNEVYKLLRYENDS